VRGGGKNPTILGRKRKGVGRLLLLHPLKEEGMKAYYILFTRPLPSPEEKVGSTCAVLEEGKGIG